MRYGKPIKNKKRIDPRYFLNEQAEEEFGTILDLVSGGYVEPRPPVAVIPSPSTPEEVETAKAAKRQERLKQLSIEPGQPGYIKLTTPEQKEEKRQELKRLWAAEKEYKRKKEERDLRLRQRKILDSHRMHRYKPGVSW